MGLAYKLEKYNRALCYISKQERGGREGERETDRERGMGGGAGTGVSETSKLSLYNFLYVYASRVDYLVKDNQLLCSSLGMMICPTLSIPWLPVVP